ncbi:MAG: hydrogenase formation protein HypD [Desulfobacterales bacterium]|nr:hydrogenase formation protein HypD [Desulfobacterales bacterium]
MTIKHSEEYREPELARQLVAAIRKTSNKPVQLMEVCGTHTMSIFRHGIRDVLPQTINLLSGPGCPVCVTSQQEIDTFIAYARQEDTIVATFGDLLRVPGTDSSLQKEKAEGRDIRVVYSAFDAVKLAAEQRGQRVVFLGVGFETTAPTIAASILAARDMGLENFHVVSAHKTVPNALEALMASEAVAISGFLLPGHVSVILGLNAYRPFFDRYQVPAVVAGFEPTDILEAIRRLVEQIEKGRPQLANAYPRAVSDTGNAKARAVLDQVFEPVDANWRGIGIIPASGLAIRDSLAQFDALRQVPVEVAEAREPAGCGCGEILTGAKIPPECKLYRKACTPENPVGPCMVSSEGTCAAYYRYHG